MGAEQRIHRPFWLLVLASAWLASTVTQSSQGSIRVPAPRSDSDLSSLNRSPETLDDERLSPRESTRCALGSLGTAEAGDPPEENSETGAGQPAIYQLLGTRFPALFRSLNPIRSLSLAWAPFAHRTRVRLEAEEMDQVRLGAFPSEAAEAGPIEGDARVRIVSWNIERGLQYEKIVQVLKEGIPADIYALQEVDLDARRTQFRDIAMSLACELQMYVAYGVEFQELTQGKSGQPALHGQATLSRFPISEARVLRFKNQPKDWSGDWFQPREGGRMALVTRVQTAAGELVLYNTHLESRGGDPGRADQMKEILDDFNQTHSGGPLLVAGDFNTAQGLISPVFQVARDLDLSLVPFQQTLSAKNARKQKDWILASGSATGTAVLHREISASDHRPVSVELSIEGKGGSKE